MVLQLKVLPSYGIGIEKNFSLDPTTNFILGGDGLFNGQSQLRVELTKRYVPSGATIRVQMSPQAGVGVERSWKIADNLDMTFGGDAMLSGKSNVRLNFQKKLTVETGWFEDWYTQ